MWPFRKREKLVVRSHDWVVFKLDGCLCNGVVINAAKDGSIFSVARHDAYRAWRKTLKTDPSALVDIYWVRAKKIVAVTGNDLPKPPEDEIPLAVADEVRKLLAVCDSEEQTAELIRSLHEGLAPVARIGARG